MSGWSVTASTITVPEIIIGEHIVRTDTQTGALVTVPVSAPIEQLPAPAVDIPAILQALLDTEIEIAGLSIMPLRSLFSALVGRVSAAEAGITDISGVRIPALVAAELSNASFDAAREAAQALKDASQDAAQAQAALEAATASGSIAAVAGRVDALEAAAPSYAAAADVSALGGRVSALEAAPGFDATAIIASVADVSGRLMGVDGRVAVLEGHDVYVESVVSAAIAVGVADAATALAAAGSAAADAALADAKAVQAQNTADGAASAASAAASAASAAQSTADAAAAAAATKEEAGLRPAVQVHYYDTEIAGAEEASQGFPQATAGAAAAEGKLVVVKTAGANTTRNAVTLPAGTPAAGARRAFLNVGVDTLAIKASDGSVIAELLAGEGGALVYVNGAWVLEAGGVSAAPPAPSEPTYPAAWATLTTGGFTANRRAIQPSDTPSGFSPSQMYPEGFLVEVKDSDGQPISAQTNYVWFESPYGKDGAGSPGVAGTEGFFISLGLALASYSFVLISVGGVDSSDAGVTYRVPIADA